MSSLRKGAQNWTEGEDNLLQVSMCMILHDLMCSSSYRCYLNDDSQMMSLFTSDLLPTAQSHISGCQATLTTDVQ